MSRSGYHNARYGPLKSLYPGICSVCDQQFPIGTPIARKGDKYVHIYCAPGGDDE